MNNWARRSLLIAFWVSIGVFAAGLVGLLSGHAERAAAPLAIGFNAAVLLLVFGLIALSARASGRSVGSLLRLRPEAPPAPELPRELARIESLREMGVTVRNFHHLYEFVVTVFPNADGSTDSPRCEVFSQLITMGQLPNFYTGRYVVLATLPGDPPQLRLDPAPTPDWGLELRSAPERYDGVLAPAPQPAAEQSAVPDAPGAPGAPVDPQKALLNLLLVALCAAVGFGVSAWFVFG